jgi:hypothetical protein
MPRCENWLHFPDGIAMRKASIGQAKPGRSGPRLSHLTEALAIVDGRLQERGSGGRFPPLRLSFRACCYTTANDYTVRDEVY